MLTEAEAGKPVPLTGFDGEVPELVVELAMDSAPAEPVRAVLNRVLAHDLEGRIAALAARIDTMDPADEGYSGAFGELIRLQDEKRRREGA